MRPKTLQVYLGWDPRETKAFDVARASIAKRTSEPIQIMPLRLEHLSILTRPIEHRNGQMWCPISDAPMSTEFAISRFCIPFLQEDGWALFADCDILCWSDIMELFALADDRYAVMVVKHQIQNPKSKIQNVKMDGQIQTYYGRKNWSSVVLWNCGHPANKRFTLDNLNRWPGRDLHAFKWLNDEEIGELPQLWNWLVNVTPGEPERRGIWHYTLGGPWFDGSHHGGQAESRPTRYDDAWKAEAIC
jgi:hypothetical protein